jgi:nucleoside-diphosphate-sugar epimerase
MMRVAVTGATGFLGGHLVDRLLAEGREMIAVVRDPAKAAALEARGVAVVLGDLTGPLATTLEADAFVHAAALSSNWGRRQDFFAANVTGTGRALVLARSMGVRRFVHISSPSIYFRLVDQFDVPEDMPLPQPINAYAETKAVAEQLALRATDIGPVILRPRGIYGPGDAALLPRLVRAARRGPLPLLRDGQAVTGLTHVHDVVAAIIAAIEAAPAAAGQPVNISGEALPIREIVEAACARHGIAPRWRALPAGVALAGARLMEMACAALPGRPEPIATVYSLGLFAYSQTLDVARAADLLGWRPRIGFAEGLATT